MSRTERSAPRAGDARGRADGSTAEEVASARGMPLYRVRSVAARTGRRRARRRGGRPLHARPRRGEGRRLASAGRPLPFRAGINRLAYVAAILIDVDGVLTVSSEPIPGATGAVRRLREAGYRLRFLTNNTTCPRARLTELLRSIGFRHRRAGAADGAAGGRPGARRPPRSGADDVGDRRGPEGNRAGRRERRRRAPRRRRRDRGVRARLLAT